MQHTSYDGGKKKTFLHHSFILYRMTPPFASVMDDSVHETARVLKIKLF